MSDKKLADTIIDKIEKEKIVPTKKEYFVLKNWVFIILCGISLLLAITGLTFNIIFLSRLDLGIVFSLPLLMIIKIVYPTIFWLSLTIGLGILTYIFFKNTQDGYKVKKRYLWLIVMVVGLILVGMGIATENRLNLTSRFAINPILRDISDPRYAIWNSPEDGRLAGEVVTKEQNSMVVSDIEGVEWNVDTSETFVPRRVVVKEGSEIKIVGEKTGENTFKAQQINTWGNGKMGCVQESGCGKRSNR